MIRDLIGIIILLSVLIFVVNVVKNYIKLKNEQKIKETIDNYEKILKKAKASRVKYLQALEESQKQMAKIDVHIKDLNRKLLAILKIREDIKDKLQIVKNFQTQEYKGTLDIRILKQSKNNLSQVWVAYNATKNGYFVLKKTILQMEGEYSELALQEETAYRTWEKERSDVLEHYNSIKDTAIVTNPYDVFSND